MKIYIVADVHGNYDGIKAVVDAFKAGEGDKLIVLGDVYNHGPRNPISQGYCPRLVRDILQSVQDKLVVIKGNCDSQVDEVFSGFKFYKNYTMANLDRTYLFTHGHEINITMPPKLPEGSVVFHGHLHQHTDVTKKGIRYLNPGSVGLPFDGEKGYYLLDGDRIEWYAI